MATFLLALVVNLTVLVGFSPLKTTAKYTLSPQFTAGTVCLIWESEDEAATPGSDCYTIENSTQRTWNKVLTLRTGVYEVWVTEVGQDAQGNAWRKASPHARVDVRSN